LGYGSFGAVYDKGDKIIKIFTSKDSAYLAFVSMVLKHKDNPHFPKMYGKPIKISDEYYGIKMEKLEVGEVNPEYISEYINNIKHGISDDDINPKIIKFIKSQGEKFEEACSLIAEILKSNSHLWDMVGQKYLKIYVTGLTKNGSIFPEKKMVNTQNVGHLLVKVEEKNQAKLHIQNV
jgi:hypothetical protein